MKIHRVRCCAVLSLAAFTLVARAADGLNTPSAENLWPHWQARITMQSVTLSPLSMNGLLGAGRLQRAVQGGAIFGDYYFALPALGGFRASGGFVSGLLGSPTDGIAPRLSGAGNDLPGTLPYVGLGYSGSPWRNGLSISADLGLVAENFGMRRAVFGTQALDSALREMRLSPLLQLGVRYAF